jgi:hypothetical protein
LRRSAVSGAAAEPCERFRGHAQRQVGIAQDEGDISARTPLTPSRTATTASDLSSVPPQNWYNEHAPSCIGRYNCVPVSGLSNHHFCDMPGQACGPCCAWGQFFNPFDAARKAGDPDLLIAYAHRSATGMPFVPKEATRCSKGRAVMRMRTWPWDKPDRVPDINCDLHAVVAEFR